MVTGVPKMVQGIPHRPNSKDCAAASAWLLTPQGLHENRARLFQEVITSADPVLCELGTSMGLALRQIGQGDLNFFSASTCTK